MTDERKPLTADETFNMMFDGYEKITENKVGVEELVQAHAACACFVIATILQSCHAAGGNQTIASIMNDLNIRTAVLVNKWVEDHSKPAGATVN